MTSVIINYKPYARGLVNMKLSDFDEYKALIPTKGGPGIDNVRKKVHPDAPERTEEEINEIIRKRAKNSIASLKMHKRGEIVMKANAVIWAVAWSIFSVYSIVNGTMLLMLPVSIGCAVGFWVLLFMSSGSIGNIDKEIEAAFEEFDKICKKN